MLVFPIGEYNAWGEAGRAAPFLESHSTGPGYLFFICLSLPFLAMLSG